MLRPSHTTDVSPQPYTLNPASYTPNQVDGMLHALKIDGHERASESFAVVNERFEVSLLAEFDQAKARWDAEVMANTVH